jgi:hypothetical protein
MYVHTCLHIYIRVCVCVYICCLHIFRLVTVVTLILLRNSVTMLREVVTNRNQVTALIYSRQTILLQVTLSDMLAAFKT